MSWRAALVAVLTLLAPGVLADDLPPGSLLLSSIKRHIRDEMARLPDYTCLQTTRRYRREAGEKPPLKLSDTILLEVLYTGNKELYGPPGTRSFPHENPSEFAGAGMSGNGIFALHLTTLFINDTAMFQYRGEEDLAGRRAVRYDYRVPLMFSGFTIHLVNGSGHVSTDGSFWADPTTLDLLRLEVKIGEIPPSLPLVSAFQSIDYARTRIGDREVTLPQSAVMEMLETSGDESRNFLAFTHCRSFAAESSISFDAASPPALGLPPKAAPAEAPPLAAGHTVAIELAAPVSERDPVGTPIGARVSANVIEKGKVVVQAGARVRGRIRRLEHRWAGGEYFIVGLEFTDIETPAGPTRFYANLQSLDESAHLKLLLVRPSVTLGGAGNEEIWTRYLPGVATFFVTGSHVNLPEGFRTVWKTKTPR